MRKEWHMAYMWETINTCRVSVGKPEGKRNTLKWLLKKWDDKPSTGLIWPRIRTNGRLLQ
jgi:hypothetical protein